MSKSKSKPYMQQEWDKIIWDATTTQRKHEMSAFIIGFVVGVLVATLIILPYVVVR